MDENRFNKIKEPETIHLEEEDSDSSEFSEDEIELVTEDLQIIGVSKQQQ